MDRAPATSEVSEAPAPRPLAGPRPHRQPFADSSLYGILLSNGVTYAAAVAQHWSVTPLMWVYWGQSVVIGIANVIRMLDLREFSTDGFKMNGCAVQPTRAAQRQTATFFAFHYGFFHLGYAIFLAAGAVGGKAAASDVPWMLVSVVSFACAHGFSLAINQGRDFRQKSPNIGTLMFYPYLRIIPMHLAIILGATVHGLALPLFIGLKTLADVGMHAIERRLFQRAD